MSATRPRILILSEWYLPGYRAGGPIRSLKHLVASLREEADFSIVTADRDFGEDRPYPDVPADEWVRRPDGCEVLYCSPDRLGWGELRALLHSRPFDILYVSGIFSPRFAVRPFLILWLERPGWRVILAPRGMISPGSLAFKRWKKRAFLALFRWSGLHRRIVFHSTGEEETRDIRAVFGEGVEVHPGADPPPPVPPASAPIGKTPGEARFVWLSRITPAKNLRWFLDRLRGAEGRIALDIYGLRQDAAYWRECEEGIAALPPNVRAVYRSLVPPEEVPRALAGSHFFVLPTLGENFGHAIYEALAAGRPVLVSDRTRWRGLEGLRAGWDLPLERPEGFERAIREAVAMDQAAYDEWSRGASRLAGEYQYGAIREGNRKLLGIAGG